MPKLNDTQSVLLATAAKREGGSLYPLPDGLKPDGVRVAKAIAALAALQLITEQETQDSDCIARTDGDLSYGLFITPAGLTVLGIEPEVENGQEGAFPGDEVPGGESPPEDQGAAPARLTKAAMVLGLLQREGGATLAELTTATGWLPHTMRAALTGLRKKGHDVVRSKRGDATCYTVAVAA
jgi:hypothetical protein